MLLFLRFCATLPTGENCISRKKFTFVRIAQSGERKSVDSNIANCKHTYMNANLCLMLVQRVQDVLHSFSRCMFLMYMKNASLNIDLYAAAIVKK